MSDAPWVKWYAGDFLNGIADLNPHEIAVYAVVLNRIYDAGEPIPDDVGKIARRCNMRPSSCAKALDGLVAADKLQRESGFITNRRAEKEIKSRQEVGEKSAQSAHTRWQKLNKKDNENNDGPMRTHSKRICESDAYQKPEARSQKPEAILDDDDKAKSSSSVSQSRETLDHIEHALREAAGLDHDPDQSLSDLSPFTAMIDEGIDFDRSIIPKVREIARKVKHRPVRPWAYFAESVANSFAAERARKPRTALSINSPERKAELDELHRIMAE